jgi:glycosyltransferase involved in cell wall biosynthesis
VGPTERVKTLLVHEWLAPLGGSENVFEALRSIVSNADTACLWNDAPARFHDITMETWLAQTRLRRSKAAALPFMHSAWSRLPIETYERVVVSSHALAHHVASRAARLGAEAFVYTHTPARYLWAPELDHRGQTFAAKAIAAPLKVIDRRNTSTTVHYAANSEFIRSRIQETWGQESIVIYPPVDTETLRSADHISGLTPEDQELLSSLPEEFILGASRLVGYKRLDRVLDLSSALAIPAVIAGSGPDEAAIRKMASDRRCETTFLGRVSTPLLHALFKRTRLFVFLPIEDFGIMPVEAMAAGTPVLVNTIGGARESVDITGGGVCIEANSSMRDLSKAAVTAMNIDMEGPAAATNHFSRESFDERVVQWLAT